LHYDPRPANRRAFLFGVQIEAVWLPRLLLHLVIMTPQTHEVFDFLGISGHNRGLG
jgi:hypothetical protein